MNRANATTLLTQQYRELAIDAKFTTQQTTDAYNASIDMSLRQLGTQESDLLTADIDQSFVMKYIALLNYYVLKRFSTLYSTKYDAKVAKGAADASRSQVFRMIMILQEQAADELTQYGIFVGNAQGFQLGRVTLDYLEPSTLSEF